MPVTSSYSTAEYQLGGLMVQLAPWDGTTPPEEADWVDMGAVSDGSATANIEKVQHFYYGIGGAKRVDKEQSTLVGCSGKFVCDQINQDTLAKFYSGTKSSTDTVNLLQAPLAEYALRFVQVLQSGYEWTMHLWKVSLSPDGDHNWMPKDDYGTIGLAFTALLDYDNHPGNEIGTATLGTPA